VSRWIAIFAAENEKRAVKMRKSKSPTHPQATAVESRDIKFLELEVARLQSALKHEKLRADAYDEMIEVAETRFKIAIRKKVGAKR
jgi:hypothetical protein